MNQPVEYVTHSLFREYLYRNNFRSTLEAFDREVPRDVNSITNRLELAKALHLIKLVKANKHREQPFKSMAEIIVADLMNKASVKNPEICIEEQPLMGEVSKDGLVIKGTFSLSKPDPRNDKRRKRKDEPTSTASSFINTPNSKPLSIVPTAQPLSITNSFSKARAARNSHLKNIGKSNSTPTKEFSALQIVGSQKVRESLTFSPNRPPSRQRNVEFESVIERPECGPPKPVEPIEHFPPYRVKLCTATDEVEDLEFIDIEGEMNTSRGDAPFRPLSAHSQPTHNLSDHTKAPSPREDITLSDAVSIRELVFGSAKGPGFNPEWIQQSFVYNDVPGLEFGLVQHKGGPCGVLAAVQSLILKRLLQNHSANLSPSNGLRQKVLAEVLASILWTAATYPGGPGVVRVCSDSGRARFPSSLLLRSDGITEKLQLVTCTSLAATEACVREFLPQFQASAGKGCIVFLYSVVLSRGVEVIRRDMDEPGAHLMANHGYCSQELVNLFLMGYAAQNVFNNTIDLDGKILKGTREQRDIGFLTLYEYYKVYEVGSYLKSPSAGIWVICSESHYSVLFSKSGTSCNPHTVTELFYYDSLGNQDSLYHLTVSPDSGVVSRDDDPPLELCIRTLWRDATVDWNGADPLL